MSEGFFLSVFAGLVGGVALIMLVRWAVAVASRWWDRKPVKKIAVANFCGDCGSRVIVFRYQRGFDEETGQPAYIKKLGCPDWDPVASQAAANAQMAAYLKAGNFMSYMSHTEPDVQTCGDMVRTSFEAATVHNHPEGEVETDCQRCIIDMEKVGILSRPEAERRLQEIAA